MNISLQNFFWWLICTFTLTPKEDLKKNQFWESSSFLLHLLDVLNLPSLSTKQDWSSLNPKADQINTILKHKLVAMLWNRITFRSLRSEGPVKIHHDQKESHLLSTKQVLLYHYNFRMEFWISDHCDGCYYTFDS